MDTSITSDHSVEMDSDKEEEMIGVDLAVGEEIGKFIFIRVVIVIVVIVIVVIVIVVIFIVIVKS